MNFTKREIIIGLIALTVVGAIGFYIYRKMNKKDLIKILVPFMLKYEGGLSRDTDDNASSYPAPWSYQGKTGWHTNKGVTYAAFVSLASAGGYAVNANNFFTMPHDIWYSVLENGYMKPYPLSLINNKPEIQAVIITWSWGSGNSGAVGSFGSERRLAQFLRAYFGINDTNITKAEIVSYFKSKVNELNVKAVFKALCDWRHQDFRRMGDWWKYGKGWTNRLNEFYSLFTGVTSRYSVNSLPSDLFVMETQYKN